MEETTPYPPIPIEPSNFDLIVIGTGLPESILAAAASAVGKTVLHLDPNPFYGTHFASFQLEDLTTFLKQTIDHIPPSQSDNVSDNFILHPLYNQSLYTSFETTSFSSKPLKNSKLFAIDLSGPRVLFCADKLIELILNTNVNQYMEFKGIDASFIGDKEGNLVSVPDSRTAIFKDKKLSFLEKNQLMRFFKLVKEHLENNSLIADEDLESPFSDFLTEKMKLSTKLKSIILYAIALADYDQENIQDCKELLKTKEGIKRLALYSSSIGRFPNAPGAMIYPIYGQGELPQAFCRKAAVKGCIYVLRMSVIGLLMDKESGSYKGVKLETGQELLSDQIIMAPSFSINPHNLISVKDCNKHKLIRGICITNKSLKQDIANCLVIYPPQSLNEEQVSTVRVLQLSSSVGVCPPGMFVIYLSALCDDDAELGKKVMRAAIESLLCVPVEDENENENEVKPFLLWSTLYIQEVNLVHCDSSSFSTTFMPDGDLHYNNLVDATKEVFEKMYPNEEFFPKANLSHEVDQDEMDS